MALLPLQSESQVGAGPSGVLVANLGRGDGSDLAAVRTAFVAGNPGYDLEYRAGVDRIERSEHTRIVFVQTGTAAATLSGLASQVTEGDILIVRPGLELRADAPLGLLLFEVSVAVPDEVPDFLRADWDPRITDEPGGCATDPGAYRRILLTWSEAVGPYVYRGLNAHRVKITDSFTHYHPLEGGFDEFYLVQATSPEARLLTSEKLEWVLEPDAVPAEHAADLLDVYPLAVGDLVYLPRGVVHRGAGGAVVQVITVPGFVPGAEIGVDHHLRALNERLGLRGADAIPLHLPTSHGPVVR
jgi:hypothetical protein